MPGLAPGWDVTEDGGVRGARGETRRVLTPAEDSLLKTLRETTGGATEAGVRGGVAGGAGLDRLMRVMINAPDVSVPLQLVLV